MNQISIAAASALIFIVSIISSPANSMMPGGISDNEKPMTTALKASLEPLQPELKEKVAAMTNADTKNLDLVPISYKTQVVAGTNYFVKYRIGSSNDYIHARIYQDFSGNIKLVSVSNIKSEADPITYF